MNHTELVVNTTYAYKKTTTGTARQMAAVAMPPGQCVILPKF